MKQERPVETVEEFKLRIAAIIYCGLRYVEIKLPRTTTRAFEEKKKAISQKRFALIVQILSAPEAAIGTTNLHYQLRLQHSLADDALNLTILREAEHLHRFVKAVGAPPTVPVRASGVARISVAVPTYLHDLNAVRAGTQGASRRST